MQVIRKRISELIPAPYNPRKDIKPGDSEYEKLKRSLEEFGYVEPVIWNAQTGYVVGGHQRLKVLRELGETEIDCVVVDLPESQEKALNIALNKINNDWDNEKLSALLEDLQNEDIDLTLTGFDLSDIEDVFVEEEYESSKKKKKLENRSQGYSNVEIDRTYNMYRLYEYAPERAVGYYNFPILKACHYVPEKLLGFDELPLKQAAEERIGVHFFCQDYQIQRMWTRPYENIERLKGFSCVLTPDFSTYWDMPMAMKIWNIYRARLIGQVMQDAGLNVIPAVRNLGDGTSEWCFEGIEPGGVYAVSTVGVYNSDNDFKEICRNEVSDIIRILKPECLLLYGATEKMNYDFGECPVKYIAVRRWVNVNAKR